MSGRLTGAALTALTAAALAAAPAYAVWKADGAGSATATGGAAPQPVTISPGTATHALYPTATPTGDVAVATTNPNTYRVHVAALELDTASGSGGFSANAAACGLTFAGADDGWDIRAGSTVPVDLLGSLAMATSAPASCQGLAVQVYIRAAP
jgi:hypothetical protein